MRASFVLVAVLCVLPLTESMCAISSSSFCSWIACAASPVILSAAGISSSFSTFSGSRTDSSGKDGARSHWTSKLFCLSRLAFASAFRSAANLSSRAWRAVLTSNAAAAVVCVSVSSARLVRLASRAFRRSSSFRSGLLPSNASHEHHRRQTPQNNQHT